MICSVCGSKAAKKYLRKSGGKEIELELCPACYEQLYPTQETGFFAAFVGHAESDPDARRRACPTCGTTLEDFRRTGLLGCAYCYRAFRTELLPTIRFVQEKTQHVGKAQSDRADINYDLMRGLAAKQERLRAQIEEAKRLGDDARLFRLKRELDAVNRRLYGGEAPE